MVMNAPSDHEHTQSAAPRLAIARESLEATPARATKLLRGIGSSLVIRSILLQVGLTRADLEEGWSLLRDACGLSDGYEEEPGSAERMPPVLGVPVTLAVSAPRHTGRIDALRAPGGYWRLQA